jgi:hypothetical protein
MANVTPNEDIKDVDVEDVIEEATENAVGSTDVVAVIAGLNNPQQGFYSSIKSDDFNTRLQIAAAMTTSEKIDNNLGKEINLANFIVQPVELQNRLTGEVNTAPRIVLIDADGAAFHATSIGLLSSLRNIISVLGEPSEWPAPVKIKIVKEMGRNGYSFFTMKFV